jgi:CheY-like chemotaxis protein
VVVGQNTVSLALKPRRILIVDDHQDGADALGKLVEQLGNEVHVAYSGIQALNAAMAFRADLMLVDLAMPEMDGCHLAQRLRQIPTLAQTKIVAITGDINPECAALAMKAGFDELLRKPIPLDEIKKVLDGKLCSNPFRTSQAPSQRQSASSEQVLQIAESTCIRNVQKSETLTRVDCEAAICAGMLRCQEEYMGWRSERIRTYFVKDLLVVRMGGALSLAEHQLCKKMPTEKGRDLIKQVRKQLMELARATMESIISRVTGVKVISMHHDLSVVTGEEVVLFSLVTEPRFRS